MTERKCMIKASEGKEGIRAAWPLICGLGACSLNRWHELRLATSGGDANIVFEIQSKAAPECVINQPSQPGPEEVPPQLPAES